jgi:hypothetical protein
MIVTAFFKGTGQFLLNARLERQPLESPDLSEEVVADLREVCYREGRNARQRKVTLHFDNALIRKTRRFDVPIAFSEFKRMKHPSYGLDLAPCDCILFAYLNERLRTGLSQRQ